MKACVIGFGVDSIVAFSIDISVIVSFRSCMTSDSNVSLWNPVITSLPYLDSGLHVLPSVHHFCFHIFRLCQGFSFPYS